MQSTPDATGPIRVGAALSLTGRFANQGQQARRGLVLWSEDFNARPGGEARSSAIERPVELLIYDDESRSSRAAALTERLIAEDRVDLLFSPYSSVLTLAAAAVAERRGKLLWNHGGSSDAIAQRGFRRVVSVLSPASRYFVGVLEMVRATRPAARRLALVHGAAGTFPQAVIGGAEAYARPRGFEIVFRAPYPADEASMPALVAEVAARRPDLVLGAGTTEAELAFARALGAERCGGALVGLVATPIQLFGEALGAGAEGFIGPSQWEPQVDDHPDIGPTSAQFAARFRGRFGAEPDYPAAQAYAAGLVAQRCVEAAGTLRDAALQAAARRLALRTFYGDFRLDAATGEQVGHSLVVVQWRGGVKRVVWPPGPATARPQPPPEVRESSP